MEGGRLRVKSDGIFYTSEGQELGYAFGAVAWKIRTRKGYIESLSLVVEDRRSCFSQRA